MCKLKLIPFTGLIQLHLNLFRLRDETEKKKSKFEYGRAWLIMTVEVGMGDSWCWREARNILKKGCNMDVCNKKKENASIAERCTMPRGSAIKWAFEGNCSGGGGAIGSSRHCWGWRCLTQRRRRTIDNELIHSPVRCHIHDITYEAHVATSYECGI
ncbi:hypothetical protein BJ165DRAFT_1418448 [Panaeolus papilionaceus]|nr:hypothetical protein BJ165DRAFT_1418448 [Panaeolus papilionaceus]